MRIAITTPMVPFVRGGAEGLADGLRDACVAAGHEADIVSIPFSREPPAELERQIAIWEGLRTERLWVKPDHVIALKFPAYAAPDARRSIWLLHQHREAFELADPNRLRTDRDFARVCERVQAIDRDVLGKAAGRNALFTIAKNVSRRLKRDSGIEAPALYHPPPGHEAIYGDGYEMVVFAPSRLEELKRQSLLIEAMAHTRSPVAAVIAGGGTLREAYQRRIDELGIGWKVKLLGPIPREEMLAWYANSLAVFFGPKDEDYGYITLEAMLAARPVVTCADSGGPLEFVVDGETGHVVEPDPARIAEAIDRLATDTARARAMGEAGRAHYASLDISWDKVVEALTCSA